MHFWFTFLWYNKQEVLTNSAWCANAEDGDITTTSMIEQFNELMQHDGDGGNTHAMLSEKHTRKYISDDASKKKESDSIARLIFL